MRSAFGVAAVSGLLLVGLAAVPLDVSAQSDSAALVKERQAAMKKMAHSFGPVLAVVRGESTNLVAAAEVADLVNQTAKRLPALFPPGSGRDAVPDSRARPEVWSQRAEFEAAAASLAEESAKLAAAARANDIEAFRAQVGPMGRSCGGCHSGREAAGGKYRYPSEEGR